ncbi:MAG: glycosyltransferase [Leptospiraceae bacterium]|nr:glycosyltransferase [Leptospiraceae bacterium]
MEVKLKICIVVYNHSFDIIKTNIESILKQEITCVIIIVDHSPNDFLESIIRKTYDSNVVQFYSRSKFNKGYGAGNNFGFTQGKLSDYYLVLNPDVVLLPGVLTSLIATLENNPKIGLSFPKVLNEDGTIQYNIKRKPTLFALLGRRFSVISKLNFIKQAMDSYEFRDFDYEKDSIVEYVGGCFMLFPSKVYHELNGFDDNYFMYFEDYDLCNKLRSRGLLIQYLSKVSIIHSWQRGSHKSIKLFSIFVKSMIRFFWKWGLKWY